MSEHPDEILIAGAGIAGLTLALALHEKGIACRIIERVRDMTPLGVGINILPHASRVLHRLGLGDVLAANSVMTREAAFYNRFGQEILTEPVGRGAGYETPQYSIHRGHLQRLLLSAFEERIGADRLHTDTTCVGFEQDAHGATLRLERTSTGASIEPVSGAVAVACDGIHSPVRKQLHPHEGAPHYTGYMMWRGVTRWEPMLSGATMVRAGWLDTGKMVIYPILDNVDGQGRQLVNWVAEIARPEPRAGRDWNRAGRLEDFAPAFADWHFDWLDVPRFIEAADAVLEFPMVDQEPLDFWTRGRVTLMGDAAHPMVPRGSNGAGQAILDADCLARLLVEMADPREALAAYEAERLDATARIVLTNRVAPPDIILKEVVDRTGDTPFARIEDVIPRAELVAMLDRYKQISGYDLQTLRQHAATR